MYLLVDMNVYLVCHTYIVPPEIVATVQGAVVTPSSTGTQIQSAALKRSKYITTKYSTARHLYVSLAVAAHRFSRDTRE